MSKLEVHKELLLLLLLHLLLLLLLFLLMLLHSQLLPGIAHSFSPTIRKELLVSEEGDPAAIQRGLAYTNPPVWMPVVVFRKEENS